MPMATYLRCEYLRARHIFRICAVFCGGGISPSAENSSVIIRGGMVVGAGRRWFDVDVAEQLPGTTPTGIRITSNAG